jgi:hypothetical protein
MKRPLYTLALAALAAVCLGTPESRAQCRARSYYYGGGYSSSSYYSTRSYYPSSYGPVAYDYAPPVKKVVKEVIKEEPVFVRFQAVIPLIEYKVADLPSYGSVYVPPPAPPNGNGAKAAPLNGSQQPPPPDSRMDQILAQNQQILQGLQRLDAKVTQLDQRVTQIERTRGAFQPAPPPPAVPPPVPKGKTPFEEGPPPKEEPKNGSPISAKLAALNKAKCAICHGKGNEGHGGDFVLSDESGAIVALSDAYLVSMQRQITKQRMPKINDRAKEHQITPLTKEEADLWFEELDRQIGLGGARK